MFPVHISNSVTVASTAGELPLDGVPFVPEECHKTLYMYVYFLFAVSFLMFLMNKVILEILT